MERIVHEAEKRDGPVLSPTEPWERTFGSDELPGNVYVYGTVMPDEDEERYEMWYTTFTLVEPDFSEFFYSICYAYSEDGIEWEKPDLGIIEYEGSTDNNIVYRGSRGHPLSVIRDSSATDEYVASGDAGTLFSSPDGLHWEISDSSLPSVTGGPDADFAAYDPRREDFMSFFRGLETVRGNNRRIQYLSRSDDFEDWSDPTAVVVPDERDDALAAEFGNEYAGAYHMPVLEYDGIYVGLLSMIMSGGSSEEVLLQLAFSRDRRSWFRPDRQPKIPFGGNDDFDSGQIYCAGSGGTGSQALIVDDEIRVYYGGWDGTHDSSNRGAAIGLATWRIDGFASLANDGESTGTVTTEVVTFEDDELLVNADLETKRGKNGLLKVEVLDAEGNVIPGFERKNCVPIRGDEVDRKVNWRGPAKLDSLTGEDIQFRLFLEDGTLYSLQFDHERIAYALDVAVKKADGDPIEGAEVTVDGLRGTTDAAGTTTFDLFNGEYTVSAVADNFEEASTDVSISDEGESITLTLDRLDLEPVAHYRLDAIQEDGTVLDASANDNDGTNDGATVVDGVVNNAFEFGGDDRFVDIPDDPSLGVENVTVAAWVSPEASERSYIFDGRGHEYLLNEREGTERPQLFLYVDGDFHRCIAPSNTVPDSEWYHVAATYDGSAMRMYIDGELVRTNEAPSGPMDVSSGPARIGNFTGKEEDPEGRDWTYQGAIDDLYVFDRALPQDAIQDLIGREPVAHYRLDEIQEDGTVLDASANDNDGTNDGATVVDGKVGNALEFPDGSYVEIEDTPDLGLETLTITAWVSSEPGNDQYIFDGRGHEYLLNERKDTERPQLMIWIDGDFYRCIAPDVPDTDWYHVAATYDGSAMRMYIDGELVRTNDTPSGSIDVSSGPARIGNYVGSGFNYDGAIDDLHVFDRALLEWEIEALKARGQQ
ncbi:MAG: LamG domain-containing protein [Halovenus sp.]